MTRCSKVVLCNLLPLFKYKFVFALEGILSEVSHFFVLLVLTIYRVVGLLVVSGTNLVCLSSTRCVHYRYLYKMFYTRLLVRSYIEDCFNNTVGDIWALLLGTRDHLPIIVSTTRSPLTESK